MYNSQLLTKFELPEEFQNNFIPEIMSKTILKHYEISKEEQDRKKFRFNTFVSQSKPRSNTLT